MQNSSYWAYVLNLAGSFSKAKWTIYMYIHAHKLKHKFVYLVHNYFVKTIFQSWSPQNTLYISRQIFNKLYLTLTP